MFVSLPESCVETPVPIEMVSVVVSTLDVYGQMSHKDGNLEMELVLLEEILPASE